MDGTATLILAGGRGDRLRPLTGSRAKPVVPFAGRRLIDFTLQNCVRSGFVHAHVLVQYRGDDVRAHVERAWSARFAGMRCLSRAETGREFLGTADAVRAVLPLLPGSRRLLVLAGDHVYRMDYRRLVEDHVRSRSAATVSVVPVPRHEAHELGVLAVGEEGAVETFVEKPDRPPGIPGRPGLSLASMGIYVFERAALESHLARHQDHTDFGRHVLPGMLDEGLRLHAHAFDADRGTRYWRDICDVDAYHGALMDLLANRIEFDSDWPESGGSSSPARFHGGPGLSAPGVARDSWIGPGSVIDGGFVERSVLGHNVKVEHHAEVVESVLLDGATVGAHAHLRRVVVDAGARIPPGASVGFTDPTAVTVVTPADVQSERAPQPA